MDTPSAYSDAFFDRYEQQMLQSARLVVPIVLRLVKPASVVDVGCGRGAWLRVFQELGVGTIRGVDGRHINRSKLLVAQERFECVDLSKPFELTGRYDLAVCLEVAEHLPDTMAPVLVDRLVGAAPVILFSAALPGQGGTRHINERMPAYWRGLFRRHGYVLLDPIRPTILTDNRIEWWYRQNTVLYASEQLVCETPQLEAYRMPEDGPGIEWVRPHLLDQDASVRTVCKHLVSAVGRAVRRRADRLARLLSLKSRGKV